MYGRDQNEADAGGRPEQKPLDRGATDGGARSSSSATRGFGIRRRTSTHEPFDGPLDAALQRDLRRPVQHPADLFDVHDTPTDVVHVAPVDVLHRKWPKGHQSDRGGQGVHREVSTPVPTLNTSPSARGWLTVRRVASTASSMKVKSRGPSVGSHTFRRPMGSSRPVASPAHSRRHSVTHGSSELVFFHQPKQMRCASI